MRVRVRTLVPAALLASALVAAPLSVRAEEKPAPADATLPTDPSLVTGTLENGLAYVVKQHANPEGHASVWLHVDSGSLNETEKQRGIAHYLEHMAFNGSANFPPGTVVSFFESLGLSFGRDQNAFTSFDQTTYQLDLPETTDEMLDKGMLFLSDVAFRLSLTEEEIESERGIIVEEKRTRSGARMRVQEQTIGHLVPGSTFGRRMPIGTDETLMSVQKPDFLDYYGKWYVPSNMTVIVVGDLTTDRAVAALTKRFGDAEAKPKPAPLDANVVLPKDPRAVVVTDPELRVATVSIVQVDAPRPPATTVGAFREDVLRFVGNWIFNRRLGTAVAEGKAPFLQATSGSSPVAKIFHSTEVRAVGQPAVWPEMLTSVATELQRARLHGFTEQELGDARTAIAAMMQTAVETEESRPARAILNAVNRAVASGDPVLSATQERDVVSGMMDGLSVAEVNATFAALYAFQAPLFQITMPDGEGVPTPDDLLAQGKAAMAVTPEASVATERATALLEKLPERGKTPEWHDHVASGVKSAWFQNGVRFHHRFMDKRKEQATIAITLAGGEIEETGANRGITQAASLAFGRPATSNLTSTQIRDLTTGKTVGVGGGAGSDALTLSVSGDPDDLETGMQVAYLLLTDPVLEAAALAQWKQGQAQAIAGRKMVPGGVMAEAFPDALYPAGEVRMRPLEQAHVDAITVEAAQAWLKRLVTTAPIEVSVVGDISLERAEKLVATYLGSLPKRERISSGLFADLRKIERPKGPIRVSRKVATTTPQAVVLDGFYSVNRDDIYDLRRMFLASRILSTRMVGTIREAKRLVYSIGASSGPAVEYPGFGVFAAQAPTDPEKAEDLVVALDETWTEFARGGPTEEEMGVVRAQIANMLDTSFEQPNFWIGRLATLDYRGQELDSVMQMTEAYQKITATEIRDVFAKYCIPENRFSVVVVPE